MGVDMADLSRGDPGVAQGRLQRDLGAGAVGVEAAPGNRSGSDGAGLVAGLEAKGIKPTVPVTEFRPGVTIAMVMDPDGNTVEFLQNTPVN